MIEYESLKEYADSRLYEMNIENHVDYSDANGLDCWYIGGYYVGLLGSDYVPHPSVIIQMTNQQFEIWKMGREDGKGDARCL